MSEKKAFIFDTNFIIQNQNLNDVVDNLSEDYSVYISQVSVDERIAQRCRDLKKQYEEVEQIKKNYSRFVTVKFKDTYENRCEYLKKYLQSNYEKLFNNRLIPLKKSKMLLEEVIERANKKLPPFSEVKDASDKGFKDFLLWISVLNYFKTSGENEIVFVTDDRSAFRGKEAYLCDEFKMETGKSIVFKPNSFYREIISSRDTESIDLQSSTTFANIDIVRDEINTTINGLCEVEYVSCYADSYLCRTFTTAILFDQEYVRNVFDGLSMKLKKHIFDKAIFASEILNFDGRIKDEEPIPIGNIEAALNIYQKILKEFPVYIDCFFETVAKILNKNYVAVPRLLVDDDNIPF